LHRGLSGLRNDVRKTECRALASAPYFCIVPEAYRLETGARLSVRNREGDEFPRTHTDKRHLSICTSSAKNIACRFRCLRNKEIQFVQRLAHLIPGNSLSGLSQFISVSEIQSGFPDADISGRLLHLGWVIADFQ